MTASAESNRTYKDQNATFILSNALPQAFENNAGRTAWENLERQTYNWALEGKDLYISSGGIGNRVYLPGDKNIVIPEFTWKNILILPRPRLTVEDVV